MRFPDDISYGATGGPSFNTEVIQVKSGAEKRQQNWSTPQYKYEVAHGVKSQEQLDILIEFFWDVAEGMANPFRFKDWSDYEIVANKSYIDRTTTSTLKLYKKYGSKIRRISKVVSGTFKLYANDVLLNSGYSIDIDTGIVSLQNPEDFNESTVFTFDCEFDVLVRFGIDEMRVSIDNYNIYTWGQIPLIEERVFI